MEIKFCNTNWQNLSVKLTKNVRLKALKFKFGIIAIRTNF